MRPLILALCLVPLVGLRASTQDLPERRSIVFACGFVVAPPKAPREWRERADAVVRVRIESNVAFEEVRPSWTTNIVTAHDALILDVVKAHPRVVGAGALQQVLQMGGRFRRADAWESQTWNGFPVMPVGSEWILFLQWDSRLDGFTLFYREHGAVQIVGNTLRTHMNLHRDWEGKSVDDFLAALRAR